VETAGRAAELSAVEMSGHARRMQNDAGEPTAVINVT